MKKTHCHPSFLTRCLTTLFCAALFALAPLPRAQAAIPIVAGVEDTGIVYTADSNGNGTYTNYHSILDLEGGNTRGITMCDFDGDGDQDLVVGHAISGNPNFSFLKNDGSNGFTNEGIVGSMFAAGGWAMDMACGDFNEDGNQDFLASGDSGQVLVMFGTGNGTFTRGRYLSIQSQSRGIDVGDFDEDGHLDIVRGVYGEGDVSVYFGDGTGGFERQLKVFDVSSGDPYGVVAGDFDGDGHVDFIMNLSGSGDSFFYKGNGLGGFAAPVAIPTLDPDDYATYDAFDYNGDCKLDIVAAVHWGRNLWYYPGNGDGTFGVQVQLNLLNGSGAVVSTPGQYLGVTAPPQTKAACAPRAVMNVDPATVAKGGAVAFDGAASTGSVATYMWDFGDGSAAVEGAANTASHTYSTEGLFTAQLQVTDNSGRKDVVKKQIRVNGALPAANAGGTYTIGEEAMRFNRWWVTANGSDSSDTEGIASYEWATGVNLVDDFEDGDDVGWGKQEGTWAITGDGGSHGYSYSQTDPGPGRTRNILATTFAENYSVEADVTINSGSGQEAQLLFDAVDINNNYEFILRGRGINDLLLYRRIDGSASQLWQSYLPFPVNLGEKYNLKVILEGSRLRMYLNGSLVLDQTIFRFPASRVGLSTYASAATFDNIHVESLPLTGSTLDHPQILFAQAGTYPLTLTVVDQAGQKTVQGTTVTVAKGAAPTAATGGPYSLGEADAYQGDWYLLPNASLSTDDGNNIYSHTFDFGDGTSFTSINKSEKESFANAGQIFYGMDVPNASLFFTAFEAGTVIDIINLQTNRTVVTNTLGRYATWWHAGPGDYIPFKIVASKPIIVDESTGNQHNSFIPSRDGGAVGHEFTFYLANGFGAHYLYALENTVVEIFDGSDRLIFRNRLAAGTVVPSGFGDGIYTVRSQGKIAIQSVGYNAFAAVPSASPATMGQGVGRLFYGAMGDPGSFAIFAHEAATVTVFDLESGTQLFQKSLALGETWFENPGGTRRLRVESTGDIETWIGSNQGAGIDNMGDDMTFIGGKALKEFRFRSLNDGAVLFVPYNNTSVTINGAAAQVFNADGFLRFDPATDYYVVADKPIFIQILGKDGNWDDFGTYLAGLAAPMHPYALTADALPAAFTLTVTATDQAGQTSTPVIALVTATPGTPPAPEAGPAQSKAEADAQDGNYTFNFQGGNSTDNNGIWRYVWDFGDGASFEGKNATHAYGMPGAYTVTLTVTDQAMQTRSDTMIVTITPGARPHAVADPIPPVAEGTDVGGGWTVNLDGRDSTDDIGIIRYLWDLGTDTFDGYAFTQGKWRTSGLVSQSNALYITGPGGSWDGAYVFSTDTCQRAPGMALEGIMSIDSGHAMVGFKNTTARYHYDNMPYAFYFANGVFQVYEDGSHRAITEPSYDDTKKYDVRIELKESAGARYYYRLHGAPDWTLLYDSDYGSATTFLRGFNVNSSTLVVDDLRDLVAGPNLTARLYKPGNVTLTVMDNAHQTDTAVLPFTVTSSKSGPVADAGGPYLARDGMPIVLDGTGSTGDRSLVSYEWSMPDGSTLYGNKVLAKFTRFATLSYPASAVASSQYGSGTWSAGQIVGEPNVGGCGDNGSAWTTSSAEMGEQWIEATYDPPVNAMAVKIRETYNPGFVTKIQLYDANNTATTLWTGTDTTNACMAWFNVAVSPTRLVSKVRVYIDTNVPGWNEIDTIALAVPPSETPPQVTLTVRDTLGAIGTKTFAVTVDPAPTVVTVPWQFHSGTEIPHDTWSGKEVLLKAVAYDSYPGDLAYSWDFGDGTPPLSGKVANPYAIETTHTYTGPEGSLYTARLTVTDGEGRTHSDTYPVVIRPDIIDTEINMAIDDGLWWLHKNQYRNPGDFNHGQWGSYAPHYASTTASSVQSFEINGHLEVGDLMEDPYVETVWNGMDYLFRGGLNSRPIGMNVYGNPDGNGNGIGIQTTNSHAPYETGMVIDAVVSSQTPGAHARTGGIAFLGRTYADITQDMVDMYAFGISDDQPNISNLGKTDYIGGWRYNWGDWPDNSASQWAAIGLIPAEKNWKLTVPDWVKKYNDNWLWYSIGKDGQGNLLDYFGYDGTGCVHFDCMATRPSGMVQMVMDGKHNLEPPDPRWTATEGYFRDPAKWASFMATETYYGWYAFAKAMRLSGQGENLTNGFNWFRGKTTAPAIMGLAENLLSRQEQTGAERGRWTPGYSHHQFGHVFSGAWSIIMLTPTLFDLPPVANAGGNRVWGSGQAITFDAANSYHLNPDKKIVFYEWDFDGDGVYDSAGTAPTARHTYSVTTAELPKAYTVTLRVTDNGESLTPPEEPLRDTDTIQVLIVEPPHAPVALPGGPYEALVGVPVTLDGSKSSDIDSIGGDFISLFQWDLDGDWDFDAASGMDVQGDRQHAAVIQYTFPAAGLYNIGLKVWDNGAFNDLNSDGIVDANEKKNHTAFTRVNVTQNSAPVAAMVVAYTVTEGVPYTFDGSGSADPNGTPVGSYLWDLDNDGRYDDGNGPTASYTWPQNGTYEIGLKVIDQENSQLSSTKRATVNVVNAPPKVQAGSDVFIYGDRTVAFNGVYVDLAGNLDAPFVISWDFGDGSHMSTLAGNHAYSEGGPYTATLTVTDKDGGIGSDFLLVKQVVNPLPVTDAGNAQVTLSWNGYAEPGGLARYQVYQSDATFNNVTGLTPVKSVNAGTKQAVITGLTNGVTYYFGVVAVNGANSFNPFVTAVAATPKEIDETPPLAVTGLRAKLLPGDMVFLEWTPSISPDVATYAIYGDSATGTVNYGSALGTVNHPTASWTSPALTRGQTYLFGVRAKDAPAGNEETNTTTVSITLSYPDLVITANSGGGSYTIAHGGNAVFSATITNNGEATATAPYAIGLLLDGIAAGSQTVGPTLAPAQSLPVTLTYQILAKSGPIAYSATLKVDSGDVVAESNEENNISAAVPLVVTKTYSLETAAAPAFVAPGNPIALTAVAKSSDDSNLALDDLGDDAVTVKATLAAKGVNVGAPLIFTFNGATGQFTHELDTTGLWGTFDANFKLYDGGGNVLATGIQTIDIGESDFHVDPLLGRDDTGDGSVTTPWKTITHALLVIESPKANIHLVPGIYGAAETFPIRMKAGVSLLGDEHAPTVIQGATDRAVLLYPPEVLIHAGDRLAHVIIKGGVTGINLVCGDSTQPDFDHVIIEENGIGINADIQKNCSFQLRHSTVRNNVAEGLKLSALGDNRGGNTTITIDHSTISGNGVGINTRAGGESNNTVALTLAIANTTISGNHNEGIGGRNAGGIWDSSPMLAITAINTVIANHTGPAVFLGSTRGGSVSLTAMNCTIADNDKGIYNEGGHLMLTNTVVWGNKNGALIGADPAQVQYCDIEDRTFDGLDTNIMAPPLFADPATGNYEPAVTSPLVDKGTEINAPHADIRDIVRPADGNGDLVLAVDIGAYEVAFSVNANATDLTVTEGETFDLDATAKANGTELTVVVYEWNFGDGQTTTGASVAHKYTDNGLYVVKITATDQTTGVKAQGRVKVTVQNAVPAVQAGDDRTADAQGALSFHDVVFTDAGVADTHTATIDWGDGKVTPAQIVETGGSGTISAGHVYTGNETSFTVVVKVRDKDGAIGTDSFTVTVSSQVGAGDVNGDGKVDLLDLQLILKLLGNGHPENGPSLRGDINGDGQIDMDDALIIEQIINDVTRQQVIP